MTWNILAILTSPIVCATLHIRRTFKAGAGMEPEGPCAGRGPVRGGGPT